MSTQEDEFVRFLSLLNEVGCLEHVVLIGSWAEYLYERVSLLEGFESNIKSMDIDFLVRNLRRPIPEVRLASEAKKRGYLVESDRLTGVTKIYSAQGIEVEFLIGKKGAGLEAALKTNLGVTAQSLRHMEMLVRSMITVDYMGMRVNVPAPEAYAVHKMIVNEERGRKQEKDAQAIVRMWPYLNEHTLRDTVASLTRRDKTRVQTFMDKQGLSIPQ